ncbi:MAG: ABC transporter permease [Cyclobacteriaceae bacterium]|nr:ABC transporter permease [Cyclobacteriaceae bacterium]
MIKNYLLITLRSLTKNKFFIFVNVFGMGIAIACCIVAYFNYDFNRSFDTYHSNAATIYRVNSVREFQNNLTSYGYVPMGLGNAIKKGIPDINKIVRYSPGGGNFRIGEELFGNDLTFVDPEFFELFTFEFIEGTQELKNKNQIIISDKLAEKYFGSENALGKPITEMLDSGKVKEYSVTGVFKEPPSNSSFYGSAYVDFYNQFDEGTPSYNENDWRNRSTLFVQVKDESRIPTIETLLTPYTENNNKIREDFIIRKFELESFVGMGVRDSYNEKPGSWTRDASPIAAVLGIGMMGIFVLLIACFNLTNTAVAISSRRLKEIGIRKVMGSTRAHLIFQFIGETAFICFLALLVGVLMADFLLIPAFNKMWPDLKLITDYFGKPDFLVFILGTLIFTSLLAGSYPAFYISHFQPTSILKGKLKFGGTNYFTRILLTLQFAISLIAIVSSFAFTENAKYQREFDLGFSKTGIVFTYLDNQSEFETYRNALTEDADIISIAGSEHHINSRSFNDPVKHDSKEVETDIMNVDDDYIQTVGLTLLEGRDFKKDSETDHKESVIITEGLARKLGMKEPLGKEIVWMDTVKYYVIGVVKDIYNRGLWRELEPVMLRYGAKEDVKHILVKVPADKLVATNQFMEARWKEIFPNKTYNGRFMDEEIVEANTVNNNIVTMFVFLGIVALLLSATGLFTLVSLNIIKKMKEIGVRKVLGASMGNISKVVNTEFVIILLIASVLGGAGGAWMSAMLMSSIWDYYQPATVATMVISATILLVTSFMSIGYKIYKTAKLNPANVLRDE